MTLSERNRLTRAINRYTGACINYSWRYGGDPDDVPDIEKARKKARLALKRVLDELMTLPAEQHHGN